MNYIFHLFNMLGIYILLSISINQKVGYSGLLSLSHAVFYGIGAYVTAITLSVFEYSYMVSLFFTIVSGIVIAFLFSYVANRVRLLYYTLATLSIQIIFSSIIYNWDSVTNGSFGIYGIPKPSLMGINIDSPLLFLFLIWLWVGIVLLFYKWFNSTTISLLIRATKDDQIAISSLGNNPYLFKTTSIIISAIIAGIAGNLYATYISYIGPTSFTLDESILVLSIILIGGLGSLKGAFAGALIYILLPELLKFLNFSESYASNIRMIIFGLLLLVIIRIRPKGIFGIYEY